MTDTTTLVLKVDSSDVSKAAVELDKLAVAGAKSERAVDGLADMFKSLRGSIDESHVKELNRQMAEMNSTNGRAAASMAQVAARMEQLAAGQEATVSALRQGNTAAAGMAAALEAMAAQGKTTAATMATANAQLKQTASISPAVAAGVWKADAAVRGLGVSAGQTAAAMRMLPAQMTDVVTQLAGGQSPFLILIQQGGQIKDSFGGLKPTFQALSGLITPLSAGLTLAGGAAATMAVAYYQGATAADELNKQLILTGRVAGVTKDQLMDMAREVSQGVVTQARAAEVLAALVSTGQVARKQMDAVGTSIVAMNQATGREVGEMVKEFAELGKAPAEASAKLNEQYHYLTLATYNQIKALEEQGRKEDAAAVAQEARAASMKKRADEVVDNLNVIERAWKRAKEGAISAWNEFAGLSQWDAVENQLKRTQTLIATKQASLQRLQGTQAGEVVAAELIKLRAEEVRLAGLKKGADDAAAAIASKQKIRDDAVAAARTIDAQVRALETGKERIKRAIDDYHSELDKIRRDDPNDKRLAPDAIAKMEAAIRGSDRSGNNAARQTAAAGMAAELARIQAQTKTTAQALAEAEQMLQGVRAAGGLADVEYFAKKRDLIEQSAALEIGALEKENAVLAARQGNEADQIRNQGKIAENLERIKQVQNEASASAKLLAIEQAEAARISAAAFAQARGSAEDYLASMRKALNRESAAAGMAEEAKRQATGRYEIDDRYEARIKAAERVREAFEKADAEQPLPNGAKRWNQDAQKSYNDLIKLAEDYREKELLVWTEKYGEIKAKEMDWRRGAARAFEDYANNAAKAGNHAANFVAGGLQRAEDAIVNFAKTGKLSFGDLFTYMADEFLRQQARMVVSSATSGSGGLMGVLGSLAGSVFGTSGMASVASAMPGDSLDNFLSLAGNFAGRAIGGPVSAGGTYNINERGEPEVLSYGNKQILMMGKQAGTVSPLRHSLDAANGRQKDDRKSDAPNVTLNMRFGSDVSPATLAAWGQQIRESIKGEILYSKNAGGMYS